MNRRVLAQMVRVGQVVKKSMRDDLTIVKVRTENMKLDKRLLMFFPCKKDKWCLDQDNKTKIGDIVVIRNLKHSATKDVNSKIDSILYQVGNTIDPLTNRPCRGTDYINMEERLIEQAKRDTEDVFVTRKVEQ